MSITERAIESLRTPDAAFVRVPNTIRQSLADIIEKLAADLAAYQLIAKDQRMQATMFAKEALKLEAQQDETQAQVAALSSRMGELVEAVKCGRKETIGRARRFSEIALANTQATAKGYRKRIRDEALEEAAKWHYGEAAKHDERTQYFIAQAKHQDARVSADSANFHRDAATAIRSMKEDG